MGQAAVAGSTLHTVLESSRAPSPYLLAEPPGYSLESMEKLNLIMAAASYPKPIRGQQYPSAAAATGPLTIAMPPSASSQQVHDFFISID